MVSHMEIIRDERKEAAKDMRERAAKLAEDAASTGTSPITGAVPLCEKIASAIRALPIDAAQESSDG